MKVKIIKTAKKLLRHRILILTRHIKSIIILCKRKKSCCIKLLACLLDSTKLTTYFSDLFYLL